MSLKEQFYKNLQEWEKHCQSWQVQLDSSHQAIRNCESYKNLVAMGRDILPYVQEVYAKRIHKDSTLIFHGLVALVLDVAGESFKIPEEIQGKMDEIRDYTIDWLDTNS